MATHNFQPSRYHVTMGPHEPVLHVASGDTIVTTTIDAYGNDAEGRFLRGGTNPQTGPFYVDGAEPGDTLVVRLDRLTPNRDVGMTETPLAANVIEPEMARDLPAEHTQTWRIDREEGIATLENPPAGLQAVRVPLAPMLGCFGVAPAREQSISTATSGRHGGNMDYRGFVAGVTVYFPVAVPGALLFVGDGHAAQGDGEIVGTGIEVSFDVQVTVQVLKGKRIEWPRGENEEWIFCAGNARPLDQALQHATSEMIRWLRDDYGLSIEAASALMGQHVQYDLGNVYDPAYTMVCKMSKRVLAEATAS